MCGVVALLSNKKLIEVDSKKVDSKKIDSKESGSK